MELFEIKKLVEKYINAETTLAEEKLLKDYFSSGQVDSALEEYRPLFSYFINESKIEFNQPVKLPNTKWHYWAVASVAVIVIIVSAFNLNRLETRQHVYIAGDKQLAKENTEALLSMVTNVVTDGVKQLEPIRELPKAKNKILK